MIIFRFLSLVLLLGAAVALGVDMYHSVQRGQLVSTPAGQMWFDLHSPSLNLTQAVIERYVWAKIWDPFLLTVLQWPTWLVLAILGVFFMVLARLFAGRR